MLRATLREFAAEPAIPDPPRRTRLDWVLVGTTSVAAVAETLLRNDLRWPVGALIVCLALMPLLLMRRQRPLLAMSIGCAVGMTFNLAVWVATGEPGGLISSAVALILIYALFRWGSGRDGLRGVPVLAATAVIGNLTDTQSVGDVISGLIVLSLAVGLGLLVRTRAISAERRVEAIRSRERERLARDLHDVVAHHVSAIVIQAQAGRAVAATDPDAAGNVLEVIEEEATRTLAEMRTIVGVLRGSDAGELAPQPCLDDIADLAEGQPVRVDVSLGGRPEVDPVVGTALFRIAQEALTNVIRHATTVEEVQIVVESIGDQVRLTVDDNGRGSANPSGTAGYGLAGMAERVALLGGTFEAGPRRPGPGWRVRAQLPLKANE